MFHKKICLGLTVLLICTAFVFSGSSTVQASTQWNVELINNSYGMNFNYTDISDDGNTVVCLSADGYFGDTSDQADSCEIIVLERNGDSWGEPIAVAQNGSKVYYTSFASRPAISGDGNTIVYFANNTTLYEIEKNAAGNWNEPQLIEVFDGGFFGDYPVIDYAGDTIACEWSEYYIGSEEYGMYVIEKEDGIWQTPVKVSKIINQYSGDLGCPSLSDDGTKLAWRQACHQFDVFYSRKSGGLWSTPEILTETENWENNVILSGDGNTVLYWEICKEDNVTTGKDLWVRKKVNGQWQDPQKITVSQEAFSLAYDCPALVNNSGTRVLFDSSQESNGISNRPLQMSEYNDGVWSTPENITETWRNCYYPRMTPDGKKVAFAGMFLNYLETSVEPPEEASSGEDDRQDPPLGNYDMWQEETQVRADRPWTIQFSANVNPETVNESTVYVRDWQDNLISTVPSVQNDNEVKVVPQENYDAGGWYYLYITTGIESENGQILSKGIRMKFTIEN